ncbi:MAG: rhomboid family intramembrane serine protease [Sedimentisphaerales bacterium]|nr:rhomboid family intramembrane serine protease [Sedimentisphaerales bacterium]
MLLPIRTNIRPRLTPYANYALIAANIVIYALTYQHNVQAGTGIVQILRPWALQFQLLPHRPQLWQFVTYAFLHGGIAHVGFNMFFLYIFGNNVNDKLGHISYLCFYLAGAVFSGVGHAIVNSASSVPTLGASGAVAAVTGAYLVLFPQTLITVLYWLIFIGTIEIPALYFIGIKMILIDNVLSATSEYVAYDAHLAGYTFGILSMLGLLATGIITHSSFDLWAMIRQWNRRRQYHDAVAGGYDPFSVRLKGKRVKARQVRTPAQREKDEKTEKLRDEIFKRVLERNLPDAAELYIELMDIDSEQVLPRQHLLDIANQLASDSRQAESARAYEQFLAHYGNYEYVEEVELMLGLLYSRYLGEPEKAIKHLRAAREKLADPGQAKMCRNELEILERSSE